MGSPQSPSYQGSTDHPLHCIVFSLRKVTFVGAGCRRHCFSVRLALADLMEAPLATRAQLSWMLSSVMTCSIQIILTPLVTGLMQWVENVVSCAMLMHEMCLRASTQILVYQPLEEEAQHPKISAQQ